MEGDESFADARRRLVSTDCLVIDETSMISALTWEKVFALAPNTSQSNINMLHILEFVIPCLQIHKYVNSKGHIFQYVFIMVCVK